VDTLSTFTDSKSRDGTSLERSVETRPERREPH
jgi:hypothetical protein